jgi:hypothetical protein
MSESVGNETIEKYWCFLSRNWHYVGYAITYKNEPWMVNFKFAKFHCYQQIQSFLITP